MAKLPFGLGPGHAATALRFWKSVRALSTQEIAQEAERPFLLALVGPETAAQALAKRLALETPNTALAPEEAPPDLTGWVRSYADAGDVPAGSLTLPTDGVAGDEGALAQALATLVVEHSDLRLALGKRVPAFRPAVAAQLIGEASWNNAKIATLSALPGILPIPNLLLPATSLGDMVLLTKNQALLLLRIAAAYGLPPDVRARTRELLPVVGGAFGWRAVARELLGIVPGGIGLIVKGSVAYAGTYTVGKAASIYYSTGQTLSGPRLRQLYKDALRDATTRVRGLARRPKPGTKERLPAVLPDKS